MIKKIILTIFFVIFSLVSHLYASPAGESVIDLGKCGKLIHPVYIDGKWFYYWDKSGDGTRADKGDLNGGKDYVSHDLLDELFNHNINGKPNTKVRNHDGYYGTTNDYRYGTINGVNLALPALDTNNSLQNGSYYLQDNQAYTNLAKIWDSYNKGFNTDGTPSGWQNSYYWSATPSPLGHVFVDLETGYVDFTFDFDSVYVVLEVL